MLDALKTVPPRDSDGNVAVFIETPKGSGHKYDLDKNSGLFAWSLELPEGLTFPFSFGFVPNTLAEDGDPLDIMLLLGGSVPSGTLVASRLIGVLKSEQTEDGETVRNDRVIAVACLSRTYADVTQLDDTRRGLSWDIESFFETYNNMIGRHFSVLERAGPEAANAQLDDAIRRAEAT